MYIFKKIIQINIFILIFMTSHRLKYYKISLLHSKLDKKISVATLFYNTYQRYIAQSTVYTLLYFVKLKGYPSHCISTMKEECLNLHMYDLGSKFLNRSIFKIIHFCLKLLNKNPLYEYIIASRLKYFMCLKCHLISNYH